MSLSLLLLWRAEELYEITERFSRWTWTISVFVSKKCVFTVTESHLWFNICLMMESGLTHLTHNTTHSILPLSLTPSSGYAGHLAFFFICPAFVCESFAFVHHTTYVWFFFSQVPQQLRLCLHFSSGSPAFKLTPWQLMTHLHTYECCTLPLLINVSFYIFNGAAVTHF